MTPFRDAIHRLKSNPDLRSEVEESISENLSFRILGEGMDDLIPRISMMTSDEYDSIKPNWGMIEGSSLEGISFIGMIDGRPVSHMTIHINSESDKEWPVEHSIWLETIFVDADFRNQGYGAETARAGGDILARILDMAQERSADAWEWFDPHPGGDTNGGGIRILSRMARVIVDHADIVADRMSSLEDVEPA